MSFTSVIFITVFLPVFLICYFAVPAKKIRVRNMVLFLFSLVFYAWGGVRYLALLLASVLLNYLGGLLVHCCDGSVRRRRAALALIVTGNVLLLGVFKYANFVTGTLASAGLPVAVTAISLPIGISFYTFQGMSYVFDVYRGRAALAKSPLTVALYISLFPQLVAGPIVRYTTVERELTDRRTTVPEFAAGAVRFMLGFGKKVILANAMGEIADQVFSRSGTALLTTPLAWLGAAAFTLQIYFDFSGYSDMAIGLGRMLGFHFNENFSYPYIADSITDFWRRWHISLSSWFRDYIYIPLGGNRRGVPRQILNLLVVWSLTGLWHGANWTFILWGLYYGLLLILEKFLIGDRLRRIPGVFRHILTLLLVMIGWVLFRSATITDAADYLAVMFGAGGSAPAETVYLLREYAVALVLSLVAILPVRDRLLSRLGNGTAVQLGTAVFAMAVFFLSYMRLVSGSFMPFIYFQF